MLLLLKYNTLKNKAIDDYYGKVFKENCLNRNQKDNDWLISH